MFEAAIFQLSTSFLVTSIFLLSFLWWYSTRRSKSLPPGPGPAVPLLGHLLLLEKDPRKQFIEWGKKYGPLFSLRFGKQLVIVMNGIDVVKEAHLKYGDFFNNRSELFVSDFISEHKGLMFTNGKQWREQRKVSVKILGSLGMGKRSMALSVQEEIAEFIKVVASYDGQEFDITNLLQCSVSNNMCSLVFGKRFEYDNPLFKRNVHRLDQVLKLLGLSSVCNFFPILQYLPGDLFNIKKIISTMRAIENEFLRPEMKSHFADFKEGDDKDFIYQYIRQMNKYQSEGRQTTLDEGNLLKVLLELFFAGTETTTTALLWTILLFAHQPELEHKCFEEIKSVIGTERYPNMSDKPNLKYIEAANLEVLRWANIANISPEHCVAEDINFRGYALPKGATVLVNVESILKDPDLWENPEEFRPERFIGPDGEIIRREELVPFGVGRRACPGETVAYMELFLYLSTLVQQFQILPPEREPLQSLEGTFGLTYTPKAFKIRCVPRNKIK